LSQIPTWQWALAHGVYGLVLGGLFARKAVVIRAIDGHSGI
jgi:hypothetical protein